VLAQNRISQQIQPVKWIFENFTKLLGLLSFSLIAAATIHDWAYFYVIGSKFRSIQTTYDYITNAIEWMPTVLLSFAIGVPLGLLISRFVLKGPDEGLSGQRARRSGRIVWILAAVPACIAVPIFGFSLFLVYPLSLLFVGLALVFLGTAASGALLKLMPSVPLSLAGAAVVASIIYVHGLMDGILDSVGNIQLASNVHNVQLKGGDAERPVMLLRSFEKGILVRIPTNDRIELIRWDQIERLGHRVSIELERSGCRWAQRFCHRPLTP
jgi:hypothetical protein